MRSLPPPWGGTRAHQRRELSTANALSRKLAHAGSYAKAAKHQRISRPGGRSGRLRIRGCLFPCVQKSGRYGACRLATLAQLRAVTESASGMRGITSRRSAPTGGASPLANVLLLKLYRLCCRRAGPSQFFESPRGISPPGAPRTVCMTLSSHTAPDIRPLLERLCLALDCSRSRLASGQGRTTQPFRSSPLQGLRRYYGLLSPAPLRYSRPRRAIPVSADRAAGWQVQQTHPV